MFGIHSKRITVRKFHVRVMNDSSWSTATKEEIFFKVLCKFVTKLLNYIALSAIIYTKTNDGTYKCKVNSGTYSSLKQETNYFPTVGFRQIQSFIYMFLLLC